MSSHTLCPKCKGGSKRELSLSTWYVGDVRHEKCHRASCPYFHREHDPNGHVEVIYRRKPTFEVETKTPSFKCLEWFLKKYPFDRSERYKLVDDPPFLQVRYVRGIAVPIYSALREHTGMVLRRYDGHEPKARTFRLGPGTEPLCGWWLTGSEPDDAWSPLWVVEDWLSAWRLHHRGVNAIALNGGEYTQAVDMAIRQHTGQYVDVNLALDHDAYTRACTAATRFPGLRPILLSDGDIKNLGSADIGRLLRNVRKHSE